MGGFCNLYVQMHCLPPLINSVNMWLTLLELHENPNYNKNISIYGGVIIDLDNIFDNSVFRYRSCTNSTVDAFKNDRLYFSTPRHFNDPFDAVIHVNGDKLLASIFRDFDEGMVSYLNTKVSDTTSFE